jgi:hypothetical protein
MWTVCSTTLTPVRRNDGTLSRTTCSFLLEWLATTTEHISTTRRIARILAAVFHLGLYSLVHQRDIDTGSEHTLRCGDLACLLSPNRFYRQRRHNYSPNQ